MPKVNRRELAEFQIALPRLEVQKTVASLAESYDSRIDTETATQVREDNRASKGSRFRSALRPCPDGGIVSFGPEWEMVERPLLEHLALLGWETLVWSERQPTENVARLSDRDVLLEQRLRSALVKINVGPNGRAVAR